MILKPLESHPLWDLASDQDPDEAPSPARTCAFCDLPALAHDIIQRHLGAQDRQSLSRTNRQMFAQLAASRLLNRSTLRVREAQDNLARLNQALAQARREGGWWRALHTDSESFVFQMSREVASDYTGAERAVRLGAALLIDAALYPLLLPTQMLIQRLDPPDCLLAPKVAQDRVDEAKGGLNLARKRHAILAALSPAHGVLTSPV